MPYLQPCTEALHDAAPGLLAGRFLSTHGSSLGLHGNEATDLCTVSTKMLSAKDLSSVVVQGLRRWCLLASNAD